MVLQRNFLLIFLPIFLLPLRFDSVCARFSSYHDSNAGLVATLTPYGLNYAKEVAVGRVLQEITPIQIPDLSSQTVTYLGTVNVSLTKINFTSAQVVDAAIDIDDGEITIFAEGVKANLTFQWHYSYAGWFGDSGTADVKVSGMQAGLTFNLTEVNGTLKMGLHEHGVVIEKLDIVLHNYYSWLYNWLVTSFQNHLRAAIESTINIGMATAALELDGYLQTFPREIAVDAVAAIDTTIVEDPIVDSTQLSIASKGQFVSISGASESHSAPYLLDLAPCGDVQKMVTVTLTEFMVNSASKVYYDAGMFEYVVDHLPESFPFRLNTAGWRFILPSLYHKFPNMDMVLNFVTTSPPVLAFDEQGMSGRVDADMAMDVVQLNGTLTGAICIQMNILVRGRAGIEGNNLTANFELQELKLELKWSEIGKFPIKAVQTVTRMLLKVVIFPALNGRMVTGFPLPVVPSVQLANATVAYGEHYLSVCTDIIYVGGYFANRQFWK